MFRPDQFLAELEILLSQVTYLRLQLSYFRLVAQEYSLHALLKSVHVRFFDCSLLALNLDGAFFLKKLLVDINRSVIRPVPAGVVHLSLHHIKRLGNSRFW